MISNLFGNLPTITKNFLIINALMLFATATLENQHINLTQILGAHNFLSPLFQPYQIVTHFFMHGDIMHLVFNMFALVMFGAHLERIWGSKRFFWFYIISALGSLLFYAGYGTWEMFQLKNAIISDQGIGAINGLNGLIKDSAKFIGNSKEYVDFLNESLTDMQALGIVNLTNENISLIGSYIESGSTPMVGASGAIYGILVGFAVLFPNTELMLLFPPIPIKAKYLVGIFMIYSLYSSFYDNTSNVAHLAHLGGGVIGFILVKLMNKNRSGFY